MVKLMQNFKKWLIQWIWFFFVAWIFVFGLYFVRWWNWLQATDWDTLTATNWNELSNKTVPTWFIWSFYLQSCPTWRKPADGTNWTPDLRWVYVRGLNSFDWWTTARNDGNQDVDWASRSLWSFQWDEIKAHKHKISTRIWATTHTAWVYPASAWEWTITDQWSSSIDSFGWTETRSKNVALIYCFKE